MENLIHWMLDNRDICRIFWICSSICGFVLLRKARQEFYKNKGLFWWIWVLIFYYAAGPAILLFGIIITIVDYYQVKNSNDNKVKERAF